ncbi:MAG: aminotransferase class V-fold PLP-dependent enzyme [Chloroflexota bacterium]
MPTLPSISSADAFRQHFPILERKHYLNSCSKGALSRHVRAGMEQYLDVWDEEGGAWPAWVAKNERVRELFAASIGAKPSEIAVVTSASVAVSALASALDFSGRRNRVVLGDFEFPTMAYIWHAQEPRGAKVEHVPPSGGRAAARPTSSGEGSHQSRSGATVTLADFRTTVDDHTLIVAGTQICYKNGARTNGRELARIAHEAGAYCILDTYQCQGTERVDVHAWDVDFLVTGALKFLVGPSGLAFLYVKEELIQRLTPTVTGWWGQENPFAYDVRENTHANSAKRFEQGTPADSCIHGGIAGLELLDAFGYERINDQVRRLARRLLDGARAMKLDVVTPIEDAAQGPTVVIRSFDAPLLVQELAGRDIVVSLREDGVRIAIHAYNSAEDIDATLNALEDRRALLVPAPA